MGVCPEQNPLYIVLFLLTNFHILATQKEKVQLILEGLLFGKKSSSRHIMRNKILMSSCLDNRFHHLTKI
jgi:hypothetical protein